MRRLCRLRALGGADGALAARTPALRVRRASRRPHTTMGRAWPEEWRLSVTAFPGIAAGDVLETLLHELVHLAVGGAPDGRRWHGREFKETMHRAAREAYGVRVSRPRNSFHGHYAAAIQRRLEPARPVHRGQLELFGAQPARHAA